MGAALRVVGGLDPKKKANKANRQVRRDGDHKHGVDLPPAELVEPDWLDVLSVEGADRAHQEWDRFTRAYVARGVLAEVDWGVLEDHCVTAGRIRECELIVLREGLTITGAMGGTVPHPATAVSARYRTHIRGTWRQLGGSPWARDLLRPTGSGDGESDPFE